MDLEELEEAIRKCTKCHLSGTRRNAVPGKGAADAEIMLIGEAPGRQEDVQGLPFVGTAGKILDDCLGAVGMNRKEVYIANILKCRPPGNRDPEKDEIKICTSYLDRQIQYIIPKVIITLGNVATAHILDKYNIKAKGSISKVHGEVFKLSSLHGVFKIMPTFHPAAAIYNPGLKEEIIKDLRKISD